MSKLRVGIIGVGSIAKVAHLPSYAKRDDVDVVAFADPEHERVVEEARTFANVAKCPEPVVYADAAQMLENETLDAVSICTPNSSHVGLAIEAARRGVHVLLEKPMATNLEEAKQLAKISEESGKVLMVGMSHRYREDVELMKRYVDGQDLGDVYYAKTRILRRRGTPRGWFTDLQIAGGGPLMDIGVHALDLTWWLMGCPVASRVNGYLRRGIGHDQLDYIHAWKASSSGNEHNEIYTTEDFASAFIRFQNGCVLQMEVSWSLNGPQDDALKVELFGTKGGLSLDPLRIYTTNHHALTEFVPTVGMGPFYQREIDHFIRCVKSGSAPCSDAAQGLEIVKLLTAISKSSDEGREIEL
ncbi:Gfo/Idh/MocA family oxidoreductase [Alicyclobacillus fastidiosus]|uniref:Gfo/Idh/MocA family oxidoreductase n=1 Tax=Alicyclobacillus fastidiosus TaxID=392011 RepID=A0ABY6ZFB9_9BACL|nr:Gfo/Idh/MocA family oxidoreductase [Alicyclobacillus fastidiosus]WAH41197.1 Gfo/Idh/MocA family oxidoreductase [Alicyclobacillus fastidiosus]GMA62775.1 oxidoreductase [Alicyclobacillus fastidiosus]